MKPNHRAVAVAVIALFTAGASATHLSRIPSPKPQPVVSIKADEGVPHNLVAAMRSDEGVPHDLLASNDCDEGMPPNLKATEESDRFMEHLEPAAKHLAGAGGVGALILEGVQVA